LKKKTFYYSAILIVVLYYLVISLSSCNKDVNPVKPNDTLPPVKPPDTISRYIWTPYWFNSELFNLYAADTNALYIIGNNLLLFFNGVNLSLYNLNDPNFAVVNVYGYDKNNIFVYGQTVNNNIILPEIKKITNGNINTYLLDNDYSLPLDILVTGPNQAWFSSYNKNRLYYFDNGTIKKYSITDNDSISSGIFYLNKNNELFVFARKLIYATHGFLYSYKYINDNFQLLSSDCYDILNPDCLQDFIIRCGSDAIMIGYNTLIRYFNGNEWVLHSNLDSIGPVKIGGISKDSLVALFTPSNIYTYGGIKWRLENDAPHLIIQNIRSSIEAKFGNIYMTYWDDVLGGYINIGRPNKNLKK